MNIPTTHQTQHSHHLIALKYVVVKFCVRLFNFTKSQINDIMTRVTLVTDKIMHIHRRCYLYIYLSKIFVRKLILFLVTCGLFLLLLGLGLILLYSCHQDQHTIVRPLIVIGEQLF